MTRHDGGGGDDARVPPSHDSDPVNPTETAEDAAGGSCCNCSVFPTDSWQQGQQPPPPKQQSRTLKSWHRWRWRKRLQTSLSTIYKSHVYYLALVNLIIWAIFSNNGKFPIVDFVQHASLCMFFKSAIFVSNQLRVCYEQYVLQLARSFLSSGFEAFASHLPTCAVRFFSISFFLLHRVLFWPCH